MNDGRLQLANFLASVWQYWLVARISQEEREQEIRNRTLRRAVRHDKVSRILQAIWSKQDQIVISRVDADARAVYLPQLEVLRLRRSGFAALAGANDFADEDFSVFYDNRPVQKRLRSFVGEPLYDRWREQAVAVDEYLSPDSYNAYAHDVGPLERVAFRRTLLVGVIDGEAWIGFRDVSLDTARGAASWSQQQTVNALRAASEPIREERLPWIKQVEETLDSQLTSVELLHSVGRELFTFADENETDEVLVDRIKDRVSGEPWLWSKYLAADLPFAIVKREDEEHMRQALGIPLDAPVVSHPVVSRGLNARYVRFEGSRGSGKTSALLHLFRNALRHTIVLRAAADERHIALCAAILREVFADRALVIIDDLEQQTFDASARSPVGRLLDRLRTHGDKTTLVIVTNETSSNTKVEEHFDAYLCEFAQPISLDEPPHAFIVAVLRAAATARGLSFDDYTLERTATLLQRWENTPAAAVRYVSSHQPGEHLRVAEAPVDLPTTAPSRHVGDARLLLRVLAALRAAGVQQITTATAWEYFQRFAASDYARFEEGLRALIATGVAREDGKLIQSQDGALRAELADRETHFGEQFVMISESLIDHVDVVARRALLFELADDALAHRNPQRALHHLDLLRREEPTFFRDWQGYFAKGLLAAGDTATAETYLSEFCENHPDESS